MSPREIVRYSCGDPNENQGDSLSHSHQASRVVVVSRVQRQFLAARRMLKNAKHIHTKLKKNEAIGESADPITFVFTFGMRSFHRNAPFRCRHHPDCCRLEQPIPKLSIGHGLSSLRSCFQQPQQRNDHRDCFHARICRVEDGKWLLYLSRTHANEKKESCTIRKPGSSNLSLDHCFENSASVTFLIS